MGFDDACLEVPRVRQTTHRALESARPASANPLRSTHCSPAHSDAVHASLRHGRLPRNTGTPPLQLPLISQRMADCPLPAGTAQVRARIRPSHPRVAPSVSRILSPRRHLRPCFLLLHVRLPSLSYSTYTDTPLTAPRALRLPKEKIPARELAVGATASVLGGFGVVALFCSVGVYV